MRHCPRTNGGQWLILRCRFQVSQPEPFPKIGDDRQRHPRPRGSRYAKGSARGLPHHHTGRCRCAAQALLRPLRDLERACPIRIRIILTDNGKEFTDRLFGLRRRAATGEHKFAQLCAELGIEHRLTPPATPRTNGMVERFNGRIEEVLQSHHFRSGEDLETTLYRYVRLYNQQLPQSALGSKSPLQAMKDWHKLKTQLFRKQPY
jgi:hypothetical protein